MNGFSVDLENPLSLHCVLPQFARESRTSRNEISHSSPDHPEISLVDNRVFTIRQPSRFRDGDEIRNNGKTTLDADWLPTFVFNTLNRVTVVFAP